MDLARVLACYGADAFTLGGWLTHDGIIPYRLLLMLTAALPALAAKDGLDVAWAVGLGSHGDHGNLFGHKMREAYPEDIR